jgi:HSP20 family molecular chaperone IbpA
MLTRPHLTAQIECMPQEDSKPSDVERYPGGYVPVPPSLPSSPSVTPANVGERHPVNVSECADRFILEMSIPGACAAYLFIRVDGKGLLIGREVATDAVASRTRLCRHEFDTEPFRRYVPMPEGVDPERICAAYTNGILQLQLPKGVAGRDCGVVEIPVY